jgi:hypothetical protein
MENKANKESTLGQGLEGATRGGNVSGNVGSGTSAPDNSALEGQATKPSKAEGERDAV